MLAIIIPLMLLTFAAYVVALNWAYVVANHRFRTRGIKRHISTMPLVAQMVVYVAAVMSPRVASPLLPGWLFWLIALSDIALLQVLGHPVRLLIKKFRAS